jgi:serine/threonine-protein kinase
MLCRVEGDPKLGIADTVALGVKDAGSDYTVARDGSSVQAPPPTSGSLARYRLEGVLGVGGMGEVVSAQDEEIGRSVAIKRMRGDNPTPEATVRFLREARIQARLDHPAVVPVHELQHDERGHPFFVMKQLTGTTLAAALQKPDAAASRPRHLRAFVDVCLAIEFAHRRGIVHRDLKPSNIMLGDFGEVYVLDWGIARVADEAKRRETFSDVDSLGGDGTGTGVALGTAGYIAPEQLRNSADLDGRADVYALGCILFELLARRPLHPRGVAHSTLEHVDARPSVHDPDVPLELDAICVRATKLDRSDRYASARELGDVVQRFLDGDRDLALRKQLAETELAAARTALAGGDRPGERRTVMRAAARALALDPTSREAAELVNRLMLEPPREVPPAVAERMAQIDLDAHYAARTRLRYATLAGVGFAPVAWLVGLPLWYATILFIAGLVVAIGMRVVPRSHEHAAWYLNVLAWLIVLAATSVATTPFLVVPQMAVVVGMVSAATQQVSPHGRRVSVTALVLAATLAPWLLTLVGVLPRSVDVAGNRLALTLASDHLAPTITLTALVGALVATTLLALTIVRTIVNQRRGIQAKLAVQAWQLRELVPSHHSGSGSPLEPRHRDSSHAAPAGAMESRDGSR